MSAATPVKVKKAAKPKKPAAHPNYAEMIVTAVKVLKEKKGSSSQQIKKYVLAHYKVDQEKAQNRIRLALRRLSNSKVLVHSKGTGASGSFKLNDKADKTDKKKPKKSAAKTKKPKSPKKVAKKPKAAGDKKPKAKKPKTPKKAKAAKPKSPKKTKTAKPKAAKKSPKKVAKPKAAKAKKAAKK